MAHIVQIAGNGFIGRPCARRLAASGRRVVVHHAGARNLPADDLIEEIVAERTPPPMTDLPDALVAAAEGAAAVIHFLCMGARDAAAFVARFDGRAKRLVLVSSGDVYRAYGRLIGTEPGPPDPTPLTETSPLRARRFPYRAKAASRDALEYWYDKLDAEEAVRNVRKSEATILRLPKVYGPGGDENLATIYGFADHPAWRWTHGAVENVAAAIALAATHPAAAGEIFNVGERRTPPMGERLKRLPPNPGAPSLGEGFDFRQHMDVSSEKIRTRLGYADVVDEAGAMRALAEAAARTR